MSEIKRLHLHYSDFAGTYELINSKNGELIYYDDYLKEIQRLQAENNQLKERIGVLEKMLTTIKKSAIKALLDQDEMVSRFDKALED